jgi:hypothetical protein
VRLLREYESGVSADVRALRKTTPRRGAVRSAGSTPPGCAGCPAGNVPEVPQIVPRREQVLRLLRHTFAGCTSPSGASARAGPAAHRAPSSARSAAASCSSEARDAPSATCRPACGTPSTASGGSVGAARGEARSAAASCSSEASGARSPSR